MLRALILLNLLTIYLLLPRNAFAQLSQDDFAKAYKRVESIYKSEAERDGFKVSFEYNLKGDGLSLNKDVAGAEVYKDLSGKILGYGTEDFGLLNENSLTLMMCHEFGHIIGGPPYMKPIQKNASQEGQSDYFAAMKCLPRILRGEFASNPESLSPIEKYVERCSKTHSDSFAIAICTNVIKAGLDLATYFEIAYPGDDPNVCEDKNDKTETQLIKYIKTVWLDYPSTQCRFDTYVAGALCTDDPSIPLDKSSFIGSECHSDSMLSKRPKCWFSEPTEQNKKFFSNERRGFSKELGYVRLKLNPDYHLNFGNIEYRDKERGKCRGKYKANLADGKDNYALEVEAICSKSGYTFLSLLLPLSKIISGETFSLEIKPRYRASSKVELLLK